MWDFASPCPPPKKNLPLAPVHFGLQGFRVATPHLFPRVFPASCIAKTSMYGRDAQAVLCWFLHLRTLRAKVWLVRLLGKIFQRSDVVVPCFMRLQGLAAPVVLLQSDFR